MKLKEVRLVKATPLHFPASSGGKSVRRKLEHIRARDGFSIEVTPLGLFLSAPGCPDQWVPTHLCVAGEVDSTHIGRRALPGEGAPASRTLPDDASILAAIESGIAYAAQRHQEEQSEAQQELPLQDVAKAEAEAKTQTQTAKGGKGKATPASVKE